ncbi:MAG: outer membrane beta-barrel protein [Bryobacteraceae bacterium]|jgi:hypothetical protein
MKTLILATCFGLAALNLSSAQEMSHFAFNVGGGFTTPLGNTGRNLNDGWNVGAGAGVNFNSWVGALVDLNYNSFGINGTTLQSIGVPGGGVHVFSATLDPIVHLTPKSHFDVYVTGGGGLYHRYIDFTQPSAAFVSGYDPYFGFFTAAVPVTQVIGSYSVNKPGFDAGAGIAFGSIWHGKFFAEAKYNRITANYHTDYLPVTFGFRW